MMETKMYLLVFSSESGDHYAGNWKGSSEPTEEELIEIVKKECPGEWYEAEISDFEGEGIGGSWVYLDSIKEIS